MSDNIIRFPSKSFKPKPKITPQEEKRFFTHTKESADNTS